MKKLIATNWILIFVIALGITAPGFSATNDQETPVNKYHHIGLFLGSLRTPYSAVVSGIDYQSPAFANGLLSIDSRLYSWGSLYFVSLNSFDLELALLAGGMLNAVRLSGGAGYKLYARLYVDERSTATTGYAPFVRGKVEIPLLHSMVDLDLVNNLDVNFHRNGIALDLAPQLSIGYSWFYLTLQAKGSALMLYQQASGGVPNYELRYDSYIGLGVRIH